jgi:DNA mismatch endonuclease (patch repair protein)
MSRIRGKNTKIDKIMEEILQEIKCKYEKYPKMYGNPDFVIRSKKIAIFCDGDFWHGYKYDEKKKPAKKFWRDKIEGNVKRDRRISRKLRGDGWTVLRFWEHDLEKRADVCSRKIRNKIKMKRFSARYN